MIITVTMNPAVDKTVEIETLKPGGLNRIRHVEWDAGGKGVNVSKTIRELGYSSTAVGFLGGNTGEMIREALDKREIENDFVQIETETRTNTKVLEADRTITELNEPGPVITREQTERLLAKLESYAGKHTLFVLSGSIPGGADDNIYAEIIRLVHKKGASVLLDADGNAFRNALEAVPDIIKPNREELEEYAGLDHPISEREILSIVREILKKGVRMAAVSMGSDGALFVDGNRAARCPALPVRPESTVGAGDAMVAALACAWEQGFDNDRTVRLCMAASAGAVTTAGTKPPSRELVDRLMPQVEIRSMADQPHPM